MQNKPTNIRDLADGNFELQELMDEIAKYDFVKIKSVSKWEEL